MKDFAAAAMLRLVRQGLQRQRMAPVEPVPPRTAGALVPLQDKRQRLAALLQHHGPLCVLRLGEAVQDLRDEPTLVALAEARDAVDLLGRWQRLERFVHSRHRVVTLALGTEICRLRHVALPGHPAPEAAEDLLVFGLLVALLRHVGIRGLRARFAGDATWRWQQGEWTDTPAPVDTAAWELAWHAEPPRPTAPPAGASGAAGASGMVGAATLEAQARAVLAADCLAPWTLARLAAELGLSRRSLQRRLTEAGLSFSSLCTEVRVTRAAQWLARSREPVAQVGYLSGFADQAHFTRCFKRWTAITPAAYRAQFGSPD